MDFLPKNKFGGSLKNPEGLLSGGEKKGHKSSSKAEGEEGPEYLKINTERSYTSFGNRRLIIEG